MHPSSFYDLRARYVYTPLYGPYSLSEALEGLIFYSLDKSRDSISIGSKWTLRHELILELSNVVDDLQDYLIYFSSKFLISPLNLPDFIKELQASYSRFKHLTIYWGALITRLVIACQIIEHDFWPHLFQLAINNPAGLQRLGQLSSSVFPNAALDKLSTHTSTLDSSSHTDSSPHSPSCSLESRHLLRNVQSERPHTKPSNTGPTGGKQHRTSSWRLDSTPTPFASCPSNRQPSVAPLKSHFPPTGEVRSDKVLMPLNCTIAVQRPCDSTPAHTGEMRELGDLEDDERDAGINEQTTREVEVTLEGAGATKVPCACSYPIQLTSIQGNVTGESMAPTRTPSSSTASPSMASQPTSTLSRPSPTLSRPSPIAPRPSSMASGLTTASRSSLMAPYISNSTHNPHQGPPFPSPWRRPFPHPFANPIPQPSTCFSLKEQHIRHFLTSIPSYSLSTAQKQCQCSKAQPPRFGHSHASSLITPPFQQLPLKFSTHPSSDPFQPYRDKQLSPKRPPSLIKVNNVRNSISPPVSSHHLYQHPASLHPRTPTPSFPKRRRCSSLPPTTFHRLNNCWLDQQNRVLLPANQLTPSSSIKFPSTSCQQLHETRNEHFRMPPSRAASTIKSKGYVSSSTPPPRIDLINPTIQDNQVPELPPLLDVPTVDNKQRLSSTTCNSNPIPFLTTPTSSPSTLWSTEENRALSLRLDTTPVPSESHRTWISLNGQPRVAPLKLRFPPAGEVCSDEVLILLNCIIAAQCLCNSSPACTSATRGLGSFKDDAKVVGTEEQLTREIRVVGEGEEVTEVTASQPVSMTREPARSSPMSKVSRPTTIPRVPAKASSPSTASWPLSTASRFTSAAPYTSLSTSSNNLSTPSLPATADNMRGTSLLMHNTHSILPPAPSHDFH